MLSRTVMLLVLAIAASSSSLLGTPEPTELFLRGYSVVPAPRAVNLGEGNVELDSSWLLRAGDLKSDHIAVRSLLADLQVFYGLRLPTQGSGPRTIELAVRPGTVTVESNTGDPVEPQAYRLEITPARIMITGNGDPGLFYGVQTLLQLVRRNEQGRLFVPEVRIDDWPSFQLRFLHFDTKHHQDRPETLKRYLDWAARFKVNMVAFELEDKFEYPSNPSIGAPGAFTTAQLQELVAYGLERFIQIVPDVQTPAHMAYVLKHPEFAHLKADGNNYQSCLCDEETYRLIFSMYDDVIKATPGIEYFLVSTDEVYYAGICAKCDKPYNPENRSLKWVEFAKRARDFMNARGRRMIAWVEYPLLTQHISLLPPDVINGVLGNETPFIEAQDKIGMRQLVYTSMQGSEYLFPNYWSARSGDFRSMEGRLWSAYETLSFEASKGKPMGVFGAAWGDSGLHNETFWLGWSAVAQYGWTRGFPSVEQHVEDFMNVYYGPSHVDMVGVYQGLQEQARFFQRSWDRVVSRTRGSGYGNSYGPGQGVIRRDETLPQPALPVLPGLDFVRRYEGRYGELVEEAGSMAEEAQKLIHRIYQNLSRVERNRFNLEVFLSIARLTQHHDRLILSMRAIEDRLDSAQRAAEANQARRAVESLISAYRIAEATVADRKATFESLEAVWEKSQFKKGRELDGRKFLHVLDDTKDHWADRRPDLSYMIAPEESIRLEDWMQNLAEVIKEYAQRHQIPVDSIVLELEPEE